MILPFKVCADPERVVSVNSIPFVAQSKGIAHRASCRAEEAPTRNIPTRMSEVGSLADKGRSQFSLNVSPWKTRHASALDEDARHIQTR